MPGRTRWAAVVGTALLVTAAWAGVLLPRSSTAVVVSIAAGVCGMGLVVAAWVELGRAAARLSTRWTLVTLLLWCAPLLVAPPLFSRDVFSYLAQGAVAARGLDPNSIGPVQGLGAGSPVAARVDEYWRDAPSPYGPLFGAVQRAVEQLTGGDPVVGIVLHRVVAVAGLALVAWAVLRLCALTGTPPAVALWLGVLNPLVLWHLVAGLHNDGLMLGLMLAGTAVALEALGADDVWWGRLVVGVVLVSLGAMIKLPAVVALAVIAIALARRGAHPSERREPDVEVLDAGPVVVAGRSVLAGAGVVLLFGLVAAATSTLTGIGWGWLGALRGVGSVESWMAPSNWPGYLGALVDVDLFDAGRAVGVVLAVIGVAWVLHRQVRGRFDAVTALGAAMAVIVVLGPVVQPWYLLWAVVPLAAAPLRAPWRVAVPVGVFALLVPPLAGDFTGRVGPLVAGYGIGVIAVGLLVAGAVWRRRTVAGEELPQLP